MNTRTYSQQTSGGLPGGLPQAPIWVPEGRGAVRAGGEAFAIEARLSCAKACGQAIYTLILRRGVDGIAHPLTPSRREGE